MQHLSSKSSSGLSLCKGVHLIRQAEHASGTAKFSIPFVQGYICIQAVHAGYHPEQQKNTLPDRIMQVYHYDGYAVSNRFNALGRPVGRLPRAILSASFSTRPPSSTPSSSSARRINASILICSSSPSSLPDALPFRF